MEKQVQKIQVEAMNKQTVESNIKQESVKNL